MEEQTKVTQADVEEAITQVDFVKLGKKTTVALATLNSGFEICVSSACVDPKDYNQSIGEELCMERIHDKVWELLGFQLQQKLAGY